MTALPTAAAVIGVVFALLSILYWLEGRRR